MDKKKLIILLSSLFLLLLIGIFIVIGITNGSNKNSNNNRESNDTNTSQIKGGTNYNHRDVDGDYEKMIKEAEEKEKLAKLAKEKKEKEKEAKEKGQKNKDLESSGTDKENTADTTKVKENGVTYITNKSGIMIPSGTASTKPVKTKKLPPSEKYKDEKPSYQKYTEDLPNSTRLKRTKETNLLHKYLKNEKVIIVNNDVSIKGDGTAIAYHKKKNGGIDTALVTILNQAGTAKKEKIKNLHYTIDFDEDYIDKHTDNCYKIAKALGMPISKNAFSNLYKKYKYGKLSDSDYKKPYSIGYNGMEVVVEW